MIEVTLNQPEFEYDIHSLIKAFYPSEYVGVSAEKKEYDEPVTSRMHVKYTDRCDNAAAGSRERQAPDGGAYLCSRSFRPPGDEEPAETECCIDASVGCDTVSICRGERSRNPADQDSDEAARRGKKPGRDLYVYEADLFCVG